MRSNAPAARSLLATALMSGVLAGGCSSTTSKRAATDAPPPTLTATQFDRSQPAIQLSAGDALGTAWYADTRGSGLGESRFAGGERRPFVITSAPTRPGGAPDSSY